MTGGSPQPVSVDEDRLPLSPGAPARGPVAVRAVALAALAGIVYLAVSGSFCFQFHQTPYAHHVLIADAMLHGQLHVRQETKERILRQGRQAGLAWIRGQEAESGRTLSPAERRQTLRSWMRYNVLHDWAVFERNLYGYWAPLAPAIMVPFVAIFGPDVSDGLVDSLFGALNVCLFYWFLRRLNGSSLLRLNESCCVALTLLFAFGTVCFYLSCVGRVWFAVQVFTLTAVLGACITLVSPTVNSWRCLISGAFFGTAFLGRNIVALLGLFFISLIWLRAPGTGSARGRAAARRAGLFLLPCLAAVGVQGWYNHARFGNVRQDGLAIQIMTGGDPRFVADYRQYGLFSPHYLSRNFKYYFWNLELPRDAEGRFNIDLEGNSMFLVTPPLLFVFLAWRPRAPIVVAALAGIVPFLAALLLYMATGFSQFGNRYLLEAMPFLLLLVAAGMYGRLSHAGYVLIVLAIAANVFGLYRYGADNFLRVEPYIRAWMLPAFVFAALAARLVFAAASLRDKSVDS